MRRAFEDNEIPIRMPLDMAPAPIVSEQDEADYSTMREVLKIIKDTKARANSVDVLDFGNKEVPIEAQILAYKFAIKEVLDPLEASLMSVIGDVKLSQKEAQNNG